MSRKSTAVTFIFISLVTLAASAPAIAQTSAADERFEAAKRRFDGELAIFRAEVASYERERAVAAKVDTIPAPPTPPALAPAEARPVSTDGSTRDENRSVATALSPSADPAERDEPGDRAPR